MQVPLEEQIAYASLAALCSVPEAQLKSVARMAMTARLLQEPIAGYVAHSALSRQFATQPHLIAWAMYMTTTSEPTAAKMAEQTARWGLTSAANKTAFNVAFDTDLPFFAHTAQSPARSQQFADYMQSVTTSPGMHVKRLLAGFDWQALGTATIVDVSAPPRVPRSG